MKTLALASLVMLFAATAMAGDAAVPASTLDGMGLAKMQQMSDTDGMTVRGKGPFDNQFFFGEGFHGPTLTNSFADHFGWQGLSGSLGGDSNPGGMGGMGGNGTPGGASNPGSSVPGLGNFSFGGFSFF